MTRSQPRFGRMIPAMVTPFDREGELDLARTEQLVDRLIVGGSDALVINGTTGESPTVFYPQKMDLFRTAVSAAAGRVPIIANVGDNCTVPYYNKPPQEGIYEHFRAIAASVDLPVVLYNIPGRCVVNMTAETTLALAHDCDNVVAVKEASGDLDQIQAIIDGMPEGFDVYSGDDSATCEIMRRGGSGVISTAGNVAPERMSEICELAAAGEWEAARAASDAFMPFMEGLFATANPILVKEALALVDFPVGGVRLPLVDATPEQSDRLRQIMRQVGVLD